MANLTTTYLGLQLKNPLVAASSGLTSSVKKIKKLADAGIGASVLKSIFEEQINNEVSHLLNKGAGNAYPEAEDYISGYLRNNSVAQHLALLENAKKTVDLPIIASINCVSSAEWTGFAKDFENAGADAIELNLFYLPSDRHETPGELEQLYVDVLTKVKQEVSIPVSIKFGIHHSNIICMADKLKAAGAAGVVMFNRFYEPDIDLNTLKLISSEVFSSPGDLRRTLRWTGIVSSKVPQLDIAASTGIHNGKAVIKQLLAGAQVTQLCSTLYINGLKIIPAILNELQAFMEKWNFNSINDFRGRLSYNTIPDSMMYERSQFMKYFSQRK